MSTVEIGNTVSVHYKGTFTSGEEFDSSYDRGEPFTFEVGAGSVVPGFDTALPGMTVGETKSFTIPPNEGYGPRVDEAIQKVPKAQFPEDFDPQPGMVVQGINPQGGQVRATINEVQEEDLLLDFNHPLAGKDLTFEIELLDIK
jgi:peptidylprolyl isomerase